MINIEGVNFKREISPRLLTDLQNGKSFLLLGPRQTGKTTLLEEIVSQLPEEKCLKFYFQLPSVRERVESDGESIVREVEARLSEQPLFLFIDEIQKIPKVMDVLQFLLDKKKIILAATGSSARKMKTLGTNWLPGRIRLEYLFPLNWKESGLLELSQRLDEQLLYGSLPGILSQPENTDREKDLAAYTHLYLEEEIRLEALTRNMPRFAKFLRLAAFESGSAPNLSKIGQTVGLSHTSIREYYQILEDTLILHRLDAFGSKRDAVLRTPRYYFFDLGVRNAAANIGHSPGILTLQRGLLFEHQVILEVIAQFKQQGQFYYYRTKQGQEVDLILEMKGKRLAFEIKSTDRPNSTDFAGLEVFCKKYKGSKGYLVCQIQKREQFGSFLALPWFELPKVLAEI